MKHNSDFKHDLEWGQMGENVVADIVAGDKTEVKSERNIWKRTRNHYVEFQSRGKPSGIATTEAKYWSVNFYLNDEFCFNITITVKKLKEICLKFKDKKFKGGDNDTSIGILVPIEELINV